jgi:polyferredoxin
MKAQKIRNAVLLFSMLVFPVTLNYFSPYLIVQGSFAGIVSGSFLLFAGLLLTSLIFGRAFCGWVCPAGALQKACAGLNGQPTGPRQNRIKYWIWTPWVGAILAGFISAGGIREVQPLYFTDHGISVSNNYAYITYFLVVGLIAGTALLLGRRSFCHSLCWMAPFMVIGSRIKNKLNAPSLHLEAAASKCVSCKACDRACPMSLRVSQMVAKEQMDHDECILCRNCVDGCHKDAIRIRFGRR